MQCFTRFIKCCVLLVTGIVQNEKVLRDTPNSTACYKYNPLYRRRQKQSEGNSELGLTESPLSLGLEKIFWGKIIAFFICSPLCYGTFQRSVPERPTSINYQRFMWIHCTRGVIAVSSLQDESYCKHRSHSEITSPID